MFVQDLLCSSQSSFQDLVIFFFQLPRVLTPNRSQRLQKELSHSRLFLILVQSTSINLSLPSSFFSNVNTIHLQSSFMEWTEVCVVTESLFKLSLPSPGSWISLWYSSSAYSCNIFLILSASIPYNFCPLLCPSLHELFPWYLIFLKRPLVFPILLFSSVSLHWSQRKAFLFLLAIFWNSAFRCVYLSFYPLPVSPLFSAIWRLPQTPILPFCISFSCRWS